MKIKFILLIIFAQVLFCQFSFAQIRGVEIKVKKANGQTADVQLYAGSYALIIGNSEYSNGWDRLSGVKSDVIAARNVLERHGFQVETEENLTSDRFESRIRRFINDYGFDRDNRLIIYYAGHGYTLNSAGDKRELGYIIPSDTPLPTRDERGFRQKAVDMYAINTFAKQIQAKHALFVFDSCFSGKLFALRNTLKVTPFIYEKVDNPVRQFITAGNETQTVPDESIFRKSFVRGLEGEADRNDDTFITGTELADYLKEKVTNYSERRQTPQYGLINDIDLDKGDFVFLLPLLSGKFPSLVGKSNSLETLPNVSKKNEENSWNLIENSQDPKDFEIFLTDFPNGEYSALAKIKLRKLLKSVPSDKNNPFALPIKSGIVRKNSINMELVYIPAGEFLMGTSDTDLSKVVNDNKQYNKNAEKSWYSNETPQRRVIFSQGFWIGKYEVTQGQWKALMEKNPSSFKNCGLDCPVDQISWNDAKEFIARLNAKNDGFEYRLPTESEWEYAARAGTQTLFAFGDALNSTQANFNGDQPFGDSSPGIFIKRPVKVGSYEPNQFGLYDMHGNVFEWCEDILSLSYNGLSTDGSANLNSGMTNYRVLRGGSFSNSGNGIRSAIRIGRSPNQRDNAFGFRIVALAKIK